MEPTSLSLIEVLEQLCCRFKQDTNLKKTCSGGIFIAIGIALLSRSYGGDDSIDYFEHFVFGFGFPSIIAYLADAFKDLIKDGLSIGGGLVRGFLLGFIEQHYGLSLFLSGFLPTFLFSLSYESNLTELRCDLWGTVAFTILFFPLLLRETATA